MSRLENTLNQGLTSNPISSIKEKQFNTLQGGLDKHLNRYTKKATNEDIGRDILAILKNNIEAKKQGFNKEYGDLVKSIEDRANAIQTQTLKTTQKEKRGVYNVANNGKNSTPLYKDLQDVEDIIKFERGKADRIVGNKVKNGYGALHIQKHLDPKAQGYVTQQEYLNMGNMIRNAKNIFEKDGKRIYEYFNSNGERFRIVVGLGGKEKTISFFSNRNLGTSRGVPQTGSNYFNPASNNIIPNPTPQSQGLSIPINNFRNTAKQITQDNARIGELGSEGVRLAKSYENLQDLGYNELLRLKGKLRDSLKNGTITGNMNEMELKQLSKALNDDFDNFVSSYGLKDAKKALDKRYADFKNTYETGKVKDLLNQEKKNSIKYEDVPKSVISSISNLKRVEKGLENTKPLKQSFVSDMKKSIITPNQSIDSGMSDFYSIDKLNSYLSKNKDSYYHAFKPKEQQGLNDFVTLGKAINYAKKVHGNPSGTAKNVDSSIMMGIGAIDPASAIGILTARALGSKFYTSKFGKK